MGQRDWSFAIQFTRSGDQRTSDEVAVRFKSFKEIEALQESDADFRVLYSFPGEFACRKLRGLYLPKFMPHSLDNSSHQAALFCGVRGGVTHLHYDIGLNHAFFMQLSGTKRVRLFPPSEGSRLYRFPGTAQSPIDLRNPDAEFKAFKGASCYEHQLQAGEALYIPSRWWHYMEYTTAGSSLSLRFHRTLAESILGKLSRVTQESLCSAATRYVPGFTSFQRQYAVFRAEGSFRSASRIPLDLL